MIKFLKALLGDTPEKHIKLGDAFYSKGKYTEAIEEYKKAAELDPQNIDVKEKIRLILREREMLKTVKTITDEVFLETKEEKIEIEDKDEEIEVKEGGDRRKFIRIYEERIVQFKPLKKIGIKSDYQDYTETISEDVSAGGISILSRDNFPPGTFLELKFSFPSAPNPIFAIGKVVRREEVQGKGEMKYLLGIKFTNISERDREKIDEYAKKYVKEKEHHEEE